MCPLITTQEAKMEVRFKNFRCFKDTGFLKLKKITLLVGENSSGKTSFLASLNHISGLINEKEIDLNSAPFELGTFQDIYCSFARKQSAKKFEYNLKLADHEFRWVFEDDRSDSKISSYQVLNEEHNISLQFELNSGAIFLEAVLSGEEQEFFEKRGARLLTNKDAKDKSLKRLKFSHNNYGFRGYDINYNLRRMIRRFELDLFERPMGILGGLFEIGRSSPHMINEDEKEKQLITELSKRLKSLEYRPWFFSILKSSENPIINFSAMAPLRNKPSRVYSFAQSRGRLTSDGEHVPDKLMRHSVTAESPRVGLERTLQKFGKESGLFKKITIKRLDGKSNYPFSIMVETANGKTSNIVDVGYGVSQLLPVIFDIISSDPYTQFLIQQPEVHLHPRAQAAFATLIVSLTKEKKQFVIETHSDFILERLKYEIEQRNIDHNDVGILFFDTEGKDTKIHQIDLGKDGLPKNTPPSYRQFFLQELEKVWP